MTSPELPRRARGGRRLFVVIAALAIVLLAGVLLTQLLAENAVLYLEPREALAQRDQLPDGEEFRLGGWIVPGSLSESDGQLSFEVTDFAEVIAVRSGATAPQLFGEDIPVLLDGAFDGDVYVATGIILRHEEEYHPPEDEADG